MGDLYIGLDESNNGRAFEIHTAIFSAYPSDACPFPEQLPKIRSLNRHKNPKLRLKGREYSFLLYTDSDKARIPPQDKLGAITASLLNEERDYNLVDNITFLMDGEKRKDEIARVFDIVSDTLGRNTPKLRAIHGGQLDQKYLIVNIADHFAYSLFRKGLDYVSEHEERKQLIY